MRVGQDDAEATAIQSPRDEGKALTLLGKASVGTNREKTTYDDGKRDEEVIILGARLSRVSEAVRREAQQGNWMGGESPRSPIDLTGAEQHKPRYFLEINLRYDRHPDSCREGL